MSDQALSGTTAECLMDFIGRHDWLPVRAFLSSYAGVQGDSVTRWKKGSPPVGASLVKVRVLLDIAGYQVTEFSPMVPPVKSFAHAIALDVISIKEAGRKLDYADEKGVYDLLLRGHTPMREKAYRLEQYVEQIEDKLLRKQEALRRKIHRLPPAQAEIIEEVQPLPVAQEATIDNLVPLETISVSSERTPVELAEALADSVRLAIVLSTMLLRSPDVVALKAAFNGSISSELEVLFDNLADIAE